MSTKLIALFSMMVLLLACQPTTAPKVSVDDARHLVTLYMGKRAWKIAFDASHNVVRSQILYYAVTLENTGADDPKSLFVSGETGDIYDPDFHLEQFASELQPPEPAVMKPAAAQ
jgi:hypothetical protein